MAKVIRQGGATKAYSIVSDYLGTPREMVDEAGNVAWKAQRDVYGVARVEEGKAEDCPWRWPGQYADEETGLYYNRLRYYDPQRGGYLSQDPIRLTGGTRLYGYPGDVLTSVDVLGLAPTPQSSCHRTLQTRRPKRTGRRQIRSGSSPLALRRFENGRIHPRVRSGCCSTKDTWLARPVSPMMMQTQRSPRPRV
jgi:RHS repeat-associated protein